MHVTTITQARRTTPPQAGFLVHTRNHLITIRSGIIWPKNTGLQKIHEALTFARIPALSRGWAAMSVRISTCQSTPKSGTYMSHIVKTPHRGIIRGLYGIIIEGLQKMLGPLITWTLVMIMTLRHAASGCLPHWALRHGHRGAPRNPLMMGSPTTPL